MDEKCKTCGNLLEIVFGDEMIQTLINQTVDKGVVKDVYELQPYDTKHIGWECKTCNESWLLEDYEKYDEYVVRLIKELQTENTTLKARLTALEKEVGLK